MGFLENIIGYNVQTYLVFLTAFFLAFNYYKKREWAGLPPGPFCFPLLGTLPFLGSDVREPLRKMGQKYGDVFTIYLGSRRVVILNSYEVIKEAFIKYAHAFSNRAEVFFIKDITEGYGIVSSDGEMWKEQRRFTHTVLKDFGFGRSLMEDNIVEESRCLVTYLEKFCGRPLNPQIIIPTSVSNVICSLIFGTRYDYDDPHFIEYMTIMQESFKSVGNAGILTVFPWLIYLRYVPGQDWLGVKKVKTIANYMEEEFKRIVEEHRRDLNINEKPHDLIDAYIRAIKKNENIEGTSYTDKQLLQIIGDLFGAGTETTSTTLQFAIILMMRHPEVMEEVHKEIDDVIGRERPPSMKDRDSMPYTQACLSEIQRVADIVPLSVPHATSEDVEFRGYHIPAGTMVLSSLYSVHRDANTWPEPEKFDPRRFIDEEGEFRKVEQLIPFSMGRRVCLGEALARMELFLFFVTLLQTYKVSVPAGYPVPEPVGELSITNMPKPFHVQFDRRL